MYRDWRQYIAIGLPACTLVNSAFGVFNYISFLVKTVRECGFVHSVQTFPTISVSRLHLCNLVIEFFKFPRPYVLDNSILPYMFNVSSSLIFWNGVFLEVTGYVISRRFLLIKLHLSADSRSTEIVSVITSTAGADTVRYADTIRNAIVGVSCPYFFKI